MAERTSIIPDSGPREVKLNFGGLWSFLSSLDYLRFLELSGAFRSMDSTNLYYVEERTELIGFVYRHVLIWINLAYLLVLLAGYYIIGNKFLLFVVGLALFYLAGGLWFVHRYTIGRGYLYQIVRDFMIWVSVFVFISWFLMDLLIFGLIPKLWRLFVAWLFDPSSQTGTINKILYPSALWIYEQLAPHIENLFGFKEFIYFYMTITPVKIFALVFPIVYFYFLARLRKSVKHEIDRLLKKRA